MDTDEVILCKDCGTPFIFTAGEQRFFQNRGWGKPIRCKACRERKKMYRAESEKYEGIYEVMRNSNSMKRDTKGTCLNRSGSVWKHIDCVFQSHDDWLDFDNYDEFVELSLLYDRSAGY